MTIEILTEADITDRLIHDLKRLSDQSGSSLPFQQPEIPLTWWKYFNNQDGGLFSEKRGRNFLGANSRLEKFYYLIIREDDTLCGAAPIVAYKVKVPGHPVPVRVLTFAGDSVLMPEKDLTVNPLNREDVIKELINGSVDLLRQGNDILILDYLPDQSPNIPILRKSIQTMGLQAGTAYETITARKGGARPWMLEALQSQLKAAQELPDLNDDSKEHLAKCVETMAHLSPQHLLFPGNRKKLENELHGLLGLLSAIQPSPPEITHFKTLMSNVPIQYPIIDLPNDRSIYMASIGKKTRKRLKYYRNRFLNIGGQFEKLSADKITQNDIKEYLALHALRWGKESVAISDKTHGFHLEVCERAASAGYLSLYFAKLDGKRIAAHACFDLYGRREAYFTGFDPEYDKMSIGRVLFLETILDAIDNAFRRYDLGYGGDGYKMKFTASYLTTHNFIIFTQANSPDLEKLFLGYECLETFKELLV